MTTKNIIKSFFSIAIVVSFFTPLLVSAQTLSRQLSIGARGTDVTLLQTFLASNPAVYPQGLVTGYFGSLTKSAVSNFQSVHNLATDGIAGKNTISVMNTQMGSGGVVATTSAPVISSVYAVPSRNDATLSWSTQQSTKGVIYYSTIPMTLSDNINSVDIGNAMVTTSTGYAQSHNLTIQGLQPNTMYYYLVYVTSNEGVVSISWPTTFYTTN